MNNNTWKQNLELLKNYCSPKSINNLIKSKIPTNIEITQQQPNIIINQKDDKKLYLHSKRTPEQEAKRQINRWIKNNSPQYPANIIIFGFAAGYHITALQNLSPQNRQIIIIEIRTGQFKKFAQTHNLQPILNNTKNLKIILSENLRSIWNETKTIIEPNIRNKTYLLIHHGSERAYPTIYPTMISQLSDFIKFLFQGWVTEAVHSKIWLDNCITNLPHYLKSPSIKQLQNICTNIPATIVAAGPSLDFTITQIKQLQTRTIIIAVGTAYKALLKNKIIPHFVVVVDGQTCVYQRQFAEIPPETSQQSILIASPNVTPPIFKLFNNRHFNFTLYAFKEFNAWLQYKNIPIEYLFGAGTVTLSAIDLAIKMGCSQILMFGFDLCLKECGTMHAQIAKHPSEQKKKDGLVHVKGNWQEKVLSMESFASYIKGTQLFLQSIPKEKQIPITNINSGGAKIEGMKLLHPEQFQIQNYPPLTQINSISTQINNILKQKYYTTNNLQEIYNNTIQELQIFSTNAHKASKICKHIYNYTANNNKLKQLETLEQQLTQLSSATILIQALLKHGELTPPQNNPDPKTIMQHASILYNTMYRAANYIQNIFKKNRSYLNPQNSLHRKKTD